MKLSNFWRPSPSVVESINRGEKQFIAWRQRLVAEAEAEWRAQLERRRAA
jgi:hypothetical protein